MKSSLRHQELQQKGQELFRKFYFGEEMSNLETFIERLYLSKKQNKYIDFLKSGVKSKS